VVFGQSEEKTMPDEIRILTQPMFTDSGVNPAAMNELEAAIKSTPRIHGRKRDDEEWNLKKYVFSKSITAELAKWAIRQSPYAYPEGLESVVKYLNEVLKRKADRYGMLSITLCELGELLYDTLYDKGIKHFDDWNKPKSREVGDIKFVTAYSEERNPDTDFIDLDALLTNVCVEIRDEWRRNSEVDKKIDEKIKGDVPW
jgi:hypothetical protein